LRIKTPLFCSLFWLHRVAREIVKRLSSICKFIPRRWWEHSRRGG